VKGKTVYRVFAGKFKDVGLADALKKKLARQDINGFVKQIEN